MNLTTLLGSSFNCQCGRRHEVPVRSFVYQTGAVDALPGILDQCKLTAARRQVVVVADARTWNICGERVYEVLDRQGGAAAKIVIPDRQDRSPICDDATFQWLKNAVADIRPSLVVAVGSGVINDLCKWVSFEMGLPYVVVATATSMNGYAAANVAPTIGGIKVLIEARPPVAVVAEPEIIEAAPFEMTAAGFGDTLAKYQSNADWLMNHLLFGEYYCKTCADIVGDLEPLYLHRPEDVKDLRHEAIRGLFEALFWTGISMTLVGTSAPASGGEHLLSHTLDMIADARGLRHDLHGRQVGLGVLFSAALYERVLAIERPHTVPPPDCIDTGFWPTPAVASALQDQYRVKHANLDTLRSKIEDRAVWQQLKAIVKPAVHSPAQYKAWLCRAGAAATIRQIGCTREQIQAAALHMHEIRKRCTIVDLAWLVGVLPTAVDPIMDEWLTD